MVKQLLYIAYYTKNTPYQYEAEKLEQCFKTFKLPYHIMAVPDLGGWQKNTHYKAFFIRQMMDKYPDISLVYIDADALIHQNPELFSELNSDIAVYYYPNPLLKEQELLSGTIYLANNLKTKRLVDQWIKMNQNFPDRMEQYNLDQAMREFKDLKITELPASYVMIYDLMQHLGIPVIEHFQASRRFRKKS